MLPPEASAPIILVFGYAKSKPSKTYSVLTEKGSGNKTIVFGFSILVLSNFIPTIYFGIFTGLAMLLSLIHI